MGMEILLIAIFVVALLAYFSFSLISLDALVHLSPGHLKKEEYVLPPLTVLCPSPERLIAILNFVRLLCTIPVLLLAYRWIRPLGSVPVVASLIGITFLLYLLPEWLLGQASMTLFRRVVQGFAYLFYPIFWVMVRLAPPTVREVMTEEEPDQKEEPHHGETQEFKGNILEAISMIEDTTVREVMTPRVEMICIAASASLNDLHQMIKEHKFSRLPVYKEKIDNVIGIVSVMDLVGFLPRQDLTAPVTDIMRPARFVPETKKVFTLLREFRETQTQMAIVIDEYGGTSGLVTMEDVLEEIVGEIQDEHDEASLDVIREKEGSYVVPGKFPVERLEEMFNISLANDDFETISGLIFSVLGRIPVVGEIVKYQNLDLEILEADKRRIHRVRIKAMPREQNAEEIV
jgi:CBS domain containing-hemolysin-like protein